ncbi:uncharacterized protein LOC111250174 [Varroa destructor]|uniref:Uncharacterized protein n=1 Tax=Varroa destructor TaxID=109461 RepID=A0A7M7KBG4_VARDE|nr:uncharacterized protein LOC111250174 [Varroa destructor]
MSYLKLLKPQTMDKVRCDFSAGLKVMLFRQQLNVTNFEVTTKTVKYQCEVKHDRNCCTSMQRSQSGITHEQIMSLLCSCNLTDKKFGVLQPRLSKRAKRHRRK